MAVSAVTSPIVALAKSQGGSIVALKIAAQAEQAIVQLVAQAQANLPNHLGRNLDIRV